MTSKAYAQSAYLAPPAADSHDAPLKYGHKVRRQRASLYDAVAGRVTTRGSTIRAHLNPSLKPLSAQQLRFQRTGAPTIYAEKPDEYNFAKRAPPGSIPDSDLLKAFHTYASDFYARMPDPRIRSRKRRGDHEETFEGMQKRLKRCRDFKSMDETALLAFGILMEEMMKESLGETGDLGLIEEGVGDREIPKPKRRRVARRRPIVIPDDDNGDTDDGEAAQAVSQAKPQSQAKQELKSKKGKKKKRKSGARKSKKRKS